MALYLGNDHRVEFIGLKNGADDTVLDAADVQVTVLDSTGTAPVSGETWPVVLTPVSGSPGDYAAKFSKDVDITVGVDYLVRVEMYDPGTDLYGQFDRLERCERREYGR